MLVYSVELYANRPNSLYDGYSQKTCAYLNGELIATCFDSNNAIGNMFNYPILERLVRAENGEHAIRKFKIWQSKGLDYDYLVGDDD